MGAGLFGSVIAERLANGLKSRVLVIDSRNHVGGNCYSELDKATSIEVHRYGTHIFHTSSKIVWTYINRFTEFNGYHHQVLTIHQGKVFQMPINLETINSFYNLNLSPSEARELIKKEVSREAIRRPKNLEEKAVCSIGRPLYEAFVRGYTIKQWGKDPRELPPSIIARLPVRYNYGEDYFVDARWQGIPLDGYAKMFDRLLSSPRINIELDCDYFKVRDDIRVREKVIYTGPIDRLFDYKYGRLEWRGVNLVKKVVDVDDFQGTSVMNYADLDTEFTRIHEPRHLHPERRYSEKKSVIFYETPTSEPDKPFYPVNTKGNARLFEKYKRLAQKEEKVVIGGRLGDYAYYDMDKAILAALTCYREKLANDCQD